MLQQQPPWSLRPINEMMVPIFYGMILILIFSVFRGRRKTNKHGDSRAGPCSIVGSQPIKCENTTLIKRVINRFFCNYVLKLAPVSPSSFSKLDYFVIPVILFCWFCTYRAILQFGETHKDMDRDGNQYQRFLYIYISMIKKIIYLQIIYRISGIQSIYYLFFNKNIIVNIYLKYLYTHTHTHIY